MTRTIWTPDDDRRAPAILKRNYLEAEMATEPVGVEGRFRLLVRDAATGNVRRDTGWFRNLILNAGLDRLGSGSAVISGAMIGTGTTTPAATQTALTTQSAYTTGAGTGSAATSNWTIAPYYAGYIYAYRFAAGTLNGNYSEIGVGWASGSCFSRCLIVDGGGNPTTLTVTSSDYLDVLYEVRFYVPTADVSGSVTVSGTTYNYTRRAARSGSWGGRSENWPSSVGAFAVLNGSSYGYYCAAAAAGTALTAVNSTSPAGMTQGTTAPTIAAYTNGNYYRDVTYNLGVGDCNTSGGIGVFGCGSSCGGLWQFQFATAIPKTSAKSGTLVVRYSWAVRP